MSKIGGMYAELAKEAYKPVEKGCRARAKRQTAVTPQRALPRSPRQAR